MNELTCNEIDEVSGGFPIAVPIVIALAGKFATKGVAGWAIGSAGLIVTTYEVAEHFGPGRIGPGVGGTPVGTTGSGGGGGGPSTGGADEWDLENC